MTKKKIEKEIYDSLYQDNSNLYIKLYKFQEKKKEQERAEKEQYESYPCK